MQAVGCNSIVVIQSPLLRPFYWGGTSIAKVGWLLKVQAPSLFWEMVPVREVQKNNYCFIDYAKAFGCVDHNKLWKILQEMGVPDYLTAFWEICIQVKKQQLELDMKQWTGSKLGKEYIKPVYCHPAYLTYMQST